jgi:hypothetical protein
MMTVYMWHEEVLIMDEGRRVQGSLVIATALRLRFT